MICKIDYLIIIDSKFLREELKWSINAWSSEVKISKVTNRMHSSVLVHICKWTILNHWDNFKLSLRRESFILEIYKILNCSAIIDIKRIRLNKSCCSWITVELSWNVIKLYNSVAKWFKEVSKNSACKYYLIRVNTSRDIKWVLCC